MIKGIELCGIVLGDSFDEKKFRIQNKEVIPGGDYMVTIENPSSIHNSYFKNLSLVHPIGGTEITMIIADNGGGYSRKDCLDIINEMNDNYLKKYGNNYDMYVAENNKEGSYMYYFYPPNYNVLSLKDSKYNELKEPVTQLLLWANKCEFEDYYTLEAILSYYQDLEDDKILEEFDTKQLEKPKLKFVGVKY